MQYLIFRLNFKINDPCEPINLSDYKLPNFIINIYREKLRRNPTLVELKHFLSEINGKRMTIDDFIKNLGNCEEHKTLLTSNWDGMPEPHFIFVSCFNDKKATGGIFLLLDELTPLIEGTSCFGLYYHTEYNILFCVTRSTPQILAFQITPEDKILRIPVEFDKYIFANDAHGILIHDKKIFVVATQGEEPPQLAESLTDYGKFVGKIVVSDFEIKNNTIEIKNSNVFNPFDCNHHHHINDLCEVENSLYLSSFSFCESSNSVESGAISKLNLHGKPIIVATDLNKPHSIKYFKKRLYVTSSGSSEILSFGSNGDKKLEYKGPDAFVRGLVITENHIYFGTSWGMGRTNSKFTNKYKGVLRFDRTSGETKLTQIPEEYDNVYDIVSDWP